MFFLSAARGRTTSGGLQALVLRDAKSIQVANANDVSLSELGLAFAANDLVIIGASLARDGTSGTTAAISAGAATGWNTLGIAVQSGLMRARGLRLLWKKVVGNETVVAALVGSGGAGTVTTRRSHIAWSFQMLGTPLLGPSPSQQISDGAPTGQTIAISGQTVPVLALSYACAASAPSSIDQIFSQTPDAGLNVSAGSSTVPSLASRLKGRLISASPSNITTSLGDVNVGNGLVSGFLRIT